MSTLSICMLMLSTPPPSSALPTSGLVWCYWAGHAALSGSCLHGEMMGPCGRVCLRGPGEMCGGRGDRYGVCGGGMACSDCNKCEGCSSSTGECAQDRECHAWGRGGLSKSEVERDRVPEIRKLKLLLYLFICLVRNKSVLNVWIQKPIFHSNVKLWTVFFTFWIIYLTFCQGKKGNAK